MKDTPQMMRRKQVEEHVQLENDHDQEGIMDTFGKTARYEDEAWETRYRGRDGVQTYYKDLLRALPTIISRS